MSVDSQKNSTDAYFPGAERESTKGKSIFFFAGMSMDGVSNLPIENQIRLENPDAKVIGYSSFLSSDIGKRERFASMMTDLQEALENSEEVEVIVYSLGMVEFAEAMYQMLNKRMKLAKQNPEQWRPLPLEKLHLVVRSPAGVLEGARQQLTQMKQFVDLLSSTMNNGPISQMEHLITFSTNQEKTPLLLEALRRCYQHRPEVEALLNDEQAGDKIQQVEPALLPDYLSRDLWLKMQLEVIDAKLIPLAEEIVQSPDSDKVEKAKHSFQEILTQRTKLMKEDKSLDRVMRRGESDVEKKDAVKNPLLLLGPIVFGSVRVARRLFFGRNLDLVKWMESQGTRVSYMVPESEVFMPLDLLKKVFGDDVEENMLLTRGTSHITLTNWPEGFVAALKRLSAKSAQANST